MKTTLRGLLAFLFIAAGSSHFVWTDTFVQVMPPYLPWPTALIYLSGLGEIMAGGLLLLRRCQRGAAWALVILLLAELPPKFHVALHPEDFPEFPLPVVAVGLALQPLLIAWAYGYTRPTQ